MSFWWRSSNSEYLERGKPKHKSSFAQDTPFANLHRATLLSVSRLVLAELQGMSGEDRLYPASWVSPA